MQHLVYIIVNIILPVFIQIGLGYLIQKKFKIGVDAPVKILLYIIIPAVLFTSVYHSNVEGSLSLIIIVYAVTHYAFMFACGRAVSKLSGFSGSSAGAFTNSIMFYNSANYCLPLIELIYGESNADAVSLLIIVILVSSTLTYSVGVYNANLGRSNLRRSIMNIFKLPLIYATASALLLRLLKINLWTPVVSAFEILGRGLVPLSLITLGAQLAMTSFNLKNPRVYLANFFRLIVSPLVTFIIVRLIGLEGLPAQVLVIASAAPSAVNTMIISIEYDNEPTFSSQVVFSSTVLSALTVSVVIFLAKTFL